MPRDPLLLLLCPSSMWVRCRPSCPRPPRPRRVRDLRVGAGLHRVVHGPCVPLASHRRLDASASRFRTCLR